MHTASRADKINTDPSDNADRPVRVIFVDDHNCVSRGLVEIFNKYKSIQVISEAHTAKEAVQATQAQHPDVVVVDAYLPQRRNSVDAVREILATVDSVHVLVLSSAFESDDIHALLDAGALGYITKSCDVDEIEQAILAVAAGQEYFCETVREVLAADMNRGEKADVLCSLTAREKEIFYAFAQGKDTGEISSLFHISQDTVASHRRNIFQKLRTKSVPELIWYAIDNHLIEG